MNGGLPASGPGGWAARRFWAGVAVTADEEGGWQVMLDGRVLRTPGKKRLTLPTQALAEAVAHEWDAQQEEIRPDTMPLTRAVNTAAEHVTERHAAVAAMLAGYAETDLLSYRAEGPDTLTRDQAEAWDPLLDWFADEYGVRLAVTSGVMPVAQDPAMLQRAQAVVADYGPFALTALHDLVTLPGSLILGLAVLAGRLSAEEAFHLSRLDEAHQEARWGRDAEAEAMAKARLEAMLTAAHLWHLIGDCGL